MDDYSEPICAECESGGSLLCCDGVCGRSFHPECLDEEPADNESWLCFDCEHEVHRCFACKHYAEIGDLVGTEAKDGDEGDIQREARGTE